MQVLVRDNNIDQALRVLKKKMQREGVFREMKRRRFYEKPSEQAAREKSEAVRRLRKLARKQAVREGLIAAPKKITFIDKKPPISSTFFACFTNGCTADYEATPELVDKRSRVEQVTVHLGVFKVGDATVQMELVD
jgi:small subunit ribosomal protein S21